MHSHKYLKKRSRGGGEGRRRGRKRVGQPGSAAEVSRVLATAAARRQLDSFHTFIRDGNIIQRGELWAGQSACSRWSTPPPLPLRAALPTAVMGWRKQSERRAPPTGCNTLDFPLVRMLCPCLAQLEVLVAAPAGNRFVLV